MTQFLAHLSPDIYVFHGTNRKRLRVIPDLDPNQNLLNRVFVFLCMDDSCYIIVVTNVCPLLQIKSAK